jgi:hypothetical protein
LNLRLLDGADTINNINLNGHDFGRQVAMVFRNTADKIESDRIFLVCRIEVDDMIGTPGRDVIKKLFG